MHPSLRVAALAAALAVAGGRPALAGFRVSVIDEVATSVAGDPSQQFVEIRMLTALQNQVKGSVLAAFDARGAPLGDVLVVPGDVSGSGERWLMATPALQAQQRITADFTFAPGLLPLEDGMICWGAPGDVAPVDPESWDHGDFARYADCVAYGRFCALAPGGDPVPATPVDHSLVRVATPAFSDQAFQCSATLTPTSIASSQGVSIAGVPCVPVPAGPCGTALPGGAPLRTDCYGEWLVFGAVGKAPVVTCHATDPSCHAGQTGDCLLRVQLCFDDAANPLYRARCTAAPISRFELRGKQKDDIDRQNARTVLDAVTRLGAESSAGSVTLPSIAALSCTTPFELLIPLERRGSRARRGVRTFRGVTTARKRDSDRLKLVCVP